jgi:hypothetical protein
VDGGKWVSPANKKIRIVSPFAIISGYRRRPYLPSFRLFMPSCADIDREIATGKVKGPAEMHMNPDIRGKLEERRRALKRQIEQDERRALLDFHIRDLDRHGIAYEVDFDTEPIVAWVFDHFPTTLSGISWSEVVEHRCEPEDAGIPVLAQELLSSGVARADDEIEVLFSNGRMPALRIRFADVIAHGTILANDFEVWLLCRQRGWMLEYVSGRGWCWGFAVSQEAGRD